MCQTGKDLEEDIALINECIKEHSKKLDLNDVIESNDQE